MIIWAASYPRAGNTLFRLLMNRIYGIPTYDFYNGRGLISQLVNGIPMEDISSHQNDIEPYFTKTHELPGEDSYPAIYIVRDGRDTLVSYAHFTIEIHNQNECNKTNDFYQTLCNLIRSTDAFGGWSQHVLSWISRKSCTAIVKYEDMMQDPLSTIQGCLDQLGVTLDPQPDFAIPMFDKLHQYFPDFFRKGKIGSWKSEMPDDLHHLFWEYHAQAMEKIGYTYSEKNGASNT